MNRGEVSEAEEKQGGGRELSGCLLPAAARGCR